MADHMSGADALITEIEARLATGSPATDVLGWLVDDHGFTWAKSADPQRLRGRGIAVSCTAGAHGLITNWIAAVRRKQVDSRARLVAKR